MTTHLVWFRQDLRLHDNLALAAACRNSSARVLALYIATPRQWATHNMSPRQAELINAQLNGLQIALAEKGIPLLFREVDDFVASVEIVKQVCAENSVTHLFYNYQYEVNERARDVEVERALRNVVCEGFDDSVILPPGAVMTGNHEMYKVFTPGKCAGSNARASGCRVSGRCAVESRIDSAAKCTAGMGSKSSRIAGVMYAIWRAGAGRNTTIAARADG